MTIDTSYLEISQKARIDELPVAFMFHRGVSIMNNLRCPHRESTKFLCDREASYQIDGTVYCQIHAQRLLSEKKNR